MLLPIEFILFLLYLAYMGEKYIPPEARTDMTKQDTGNLPIEISESEVEMSAVRASGAGGQKVNKTASKIELRWDLAASDLLTDEQKTLVRERLASRINRDGVLVVQAQQERSQAQNKRLALERLNQLVNAALEVDPERVTKVKRSVKKKMDRKRLEEKKKQAEKKMRRQKISRDNW